MENTIGAFDAKMHLSRILEEVKKGKEFIITKRGKAIARLLPFVEESEVMTPREIIKKFRLIRKSVDGPVNIKEYIEDGRKY